MKRYSRRRRDSVIPQATQLLEQRRLPTVVASITLVASQPQIRVEDSFEIEVFTQDLRTAGPGTGLLAAFADVEVDGTVLRIDSIAYTMDDLTGGTIGPGEVDEFGGIELVGPAARTPQKVGSVFVTAIAAGSTIIRTNAGEALQSEIVLHGIDGDHRESTQFNDLSLTVLPAGALEIDLDAGESLLISDAGGSVEVLQNGVRDEAVALLSSEVTSIVVTLGGANYVDLRGVTPSDFGDGQTVSVIIKGSSTGDTVLGSEFADWVSGRGGNDSLSGFGGADSLIGNGGNDTLIGGEGDDELRGGWGRDKLEGQAGHDLLIGNTGHDTLHGGEGNDFLKGMSGHDVLYGDAGDDTLRGYAGHDAIEGGNGDDLLLGYRGRDTLTGSAGNDTLDGGGGRDQVREEADSDFLLNDALLMGHGTDELQRIEEAELTGGNSSNVIDAAFFSGQAWLYGEGGDDTLIGGSASDLLATGSGSDVAHGHDGDDTLVGDLATDDLIGGAGDNQIRESL